MKRAVYTILNALVWGAVIIGCSLRLKDTGAFSEIQGILAGGAVVSMFLSILILARKKDQQDV